MGGEEVDSVDDGETFPSQQLTLIATSQDEGPGR